MPAIDLFTRRVERLERAQHESNETLGRVATVLEVHSRHFERMEDALLGISAGVDRLGQRIDHMGERIDRMCDRLDHLTTAIARGRTKDLLRFDDHERRLKTLEPKRRKPRA